jgi:hypothetical protein
VADLAVADLMAAIMPNQYRHYHHTQQQQQRVHRHSSFLGEDFDEGRRLM